YDPVAPPGRSCHVERNVEPMHFSAIAVHELIGPLQPRCARPIADDPKADQQSLWRLAFLDAAEPFDLAKDCGRLQAKEQFARVQRSVGDSVGRFTRLERGQRLVYGSHCSSVPLVNTGTSSANISS